MSNATRSASGGVRMGGSTLGSAAVGGALAYALGYVFTYVLAGSAVRQSSYGEILELVGDGGQGWKLLGWVFYNAHYASTTITIDTGIPFLGGTEVVDLIAQLGLPALLYAVPPALLLAAGIFAATWAGAADVGDAVRVGPAVTLGYLPLAVAGAFLFRITYEGSFGGPTLVTAVGLAGLVYPLVFGTIGAVVGSVLTGRA